MLCTAQVRQHHDVDCPFRSLSSSMHAMLHIMYLESPDRYVSMSHSGTCIRDDRNFLTRLRLPKKPKLSSFQSRSVEKTSMTSTKTSGFRSIVRQCVRHSISSSCTFLDDSSCSALRSNVPGNISSISRSPPVFSATTRSASEKAASGMRGIFSSKDRSAGLEAAKKLAATKARHIVDGKRFDTVAQCRCGLQSI